MKLVSMKLSKSEKKSSAPAVTEAEQPDYPYGLELSLEKEQIEKLGLETPKAGAEFILAARVEVRRISVTDEKDGKGYKSVALQVTDMALEKPGVDNAAIAKALYGGKE